MSKISLKHSGGNVVSLNSPTSAPTSADVAFKLPNQDGSASEALITDGSGNLSFASVAGGKIAQVKAAFKTDTFSHTGTSFGAITGLSVSLAKTNASNKLLLMADVNGGRDGTINILFKMYQDGSEMTALNNSGSGSNLCFMHWVSVNSNGNHGAGDNPNMNGAALFDGPNDTNSHTYQLYQAAESAGRVVYVNRRGSSTGNAGTSCLTIFEVAS